MDLVFPRGPIGSKEAKQSLRITFAFTRDGDEVHLSGIAVAREEEKEGSLAIVGCGKTTNTKNKERSLKV